MFFNLIGVTNQKVVFKLKTEMKSDLKEGLLYLYNLKQLNINKKERAKLWLNFIKNKLFFAKDN